MNILDFFNFITSMPDIGVGWGLYGPPGTTYSAGAFTSTGPDVIVTKGTSTSLGLEDVVYFTAQMSFITINDVITLNGADSDPFYGSGILSVYDDITTGLQFAFVLTNKTVYALYSRSPALRTPTNNYFAFTYLVPILSRLPTDYNVYTLVLNRKTQQVTWLINGNVKLLISRVGQAIDNRFSLVNLAGNQPASVFPTAVKTAFGIYTFTDSNAYTACQGTIFDYCTQNVQAASQNICAYAPLPTPGYNADMAFVVSSYSASSASTLPPSCGCLP